MCIMRPAKLSMDEIFFSHLLLIQVKSMKIGLSGNVNKRFSITVYLYGLISSILSGMATNAIAESIEYPHDPDIVVERYLDPTPKAYSNFGDMITSTSEGHLVVASKVWHPAYGDNIHILDKETGSPIGAITSSTKKFVKQLFSTKQGNIVIVYSEDSSGPGGVMVYDPKAPDSPIFALTDIPAEHEIGFSRTHMASAVHEQGFYIGSKVGVYSFNILQDGNIQQGETLTGGAEVGFSNSVAATLSHQLVVGSPSASVTIDDVAISGAGQIQLFDVDINSSTQARTVTPGLVISNPEPMENANFGERLKVLSSGHIVVLARNYQANGSSSKRGKLYVFDSLGQPVTNIPGPDNLSFSTADIQLAESADGNILIGNNRHSASGQEVVGAVLEYSPVTGEMVKKYISPESNRAYSFGTHVVMGNNGDFYVSYPNYTVNNGTDNQINYGGTVFGFSSAPKLVSFNATSELINKGESFTLSWAFTGRADVAITQTSILSGAPTSNVEITDGVQSVVLQPTGSAVYEITLSQSGTDFVTQSITVNVSGSDWDNDGMPDQWEIDNELNPLDASDAALDGDEDGLTNIEEFTHDTDPSESDTDGDQIPDGYEVKVGLDPNDLSDSDQIVYYPQFPQYKFDVTTSEDQIYSFSGYQFLNKLTNGNLVIARYYWSDDENESIYVVNGETFELVAKLNSPSRLYLREVAATPNGGLAISYFDHEAGKWGVQFISGEDYKTVLYRYSAVSDLVSMGFNISKVKSKLVDNVLHLSGLGEIFRFEISDENKVTRLASIVDPSGEQDNYFGQSFDVSENGDFIVGTPRTAAEDSNSVLRSNVGEAKIIWKDSNGNYRVKRIFKNPNPSSSDQFGSEVLALKDGNYLVSAPRDVSDIGKFYIFSPNGGDPLYTFSGPRDSYFYYDKISMWQDDNEDIYIGSISARINKATKGSIYKFSKEGKLLETITPPNVDNARSFGAFITPSEKGLFHFSDFTQTEINEDELHYSVGALYHVSSVDQLDKGLVASKKIIELGDTVTLSWDNVEGNIESLTSSSIYPGDQNLQLSLPAEGTSVEVTPQFSTRYILTYDNGKTSQVSIKLKYSDWGGESIDDEWEVLHGFNPLQTNAASDTDQDGLTELEEFTYGTNPHVFDTDGDGLSDGYEIRVGFNPTDNQDVVNDATRSVVFDGAANITSEYFGKRVAVSNDFVAFAPNLWDTSESKDIHVFSTETNEIVERITTDVRRLVYQMKFTNNGDLVVTFYQYGETTSRGIEIISGQDFKTVLFSDTSYSTSSGFGNSLEVTDNKVLVGATNGRGLIYVFDLYSNGTLSAPKTISNPASNTTNSSSFGYSISTSGRWLYAGVANNDITGSTGNNISRAGVVNVYYLYNSGVYTYQRTINSPLEMGSNYFGSRIKALSNGNVLVSDKWSSRTLESGVKLTSSLYVYNYKGNQIGVIEPPETGVFSNIQNIVEDQYGDIYVAVSKAKLNNVSTYVIYQFAAGSYELVRKYYSPDNQLSGRFSFGMEMNSKGDLYVGDYIFNREVDSETTVSGSGRGYKLPYLPRLKTFSAASDVGTEDNTFNLRWQVVGNAVVEILSQPIGGYGPLKTLYLGSDKTELSITPDASTQYIARVKVGNQIVDEKQYGVSVPDSDWDRDGLTDEWEEKYGFNPLVADADLDHDNDGLSNLEEFELNTDPLNSDVDGDGILDGEDKPKLVYVTQPRIRNGGWSNIDEDGINRLNSYYSRMYWTADSTASHFIVRQRQEGEEDWQETQVTRNYFDFYGYDLEQYELGVKTCTEFGCGPYAELPNPVLFDLPAIEAEYPLSRPGYGVRVKVVNGTRTESRNYCLADPETNHCKDYQLFVSRGSYAEPLSNNDQICIYNKGEGRCSNYDSLTGYLTIDADELPVGIYTYYVVKKSQPNNYLWRDRFHVYLETEGEFKTDGCLIDPDGVDCLANLHWQYNGEYPVCLHETTSGQDVQVWCNEKGDQSGIERVQVDYTGRSFELRAQEPAAERVITEINVEGRYQGISLIADDETCRMFYGNTTCTTRVTWASTADYNACLFANGELYSCAKSGELSVTIPLGWKHYELRDGEDIGSRLLAKQSIRARYFASGEFEIEDQTSNGMCTIPEGETRCTIRTITRHWYSDGALLFKNGEYFTDLGLSSQQPQQQPWNIYAEEGGTVWSMHEIEDGVNRELARITLMPTTFASNGYALTPQGSATCELDPTVSPYECKITVDIEMPNSTEACLFKFNDPNHPADCYNYSFPGGFRVKAGENIYELRKPANPRFDENKKLIKGELVAQVALFGEEKTVSKLSISHNRCTVGDNRPDCIITADVFTNESGNICLFLDDEPVENYCNLSRGSKIKHNFTLIGEHKYRLVKVSDAGAVIEELASETIKGVEAFVRNTHLDVTATDCIAGKGYCDINIQAYSNQKACLYNLFDAITNDSGVPVCIDSESIQSPLNINVRLSEGQHTIRLNGIGAEGYYDIVYESATVKNIADNAGGSDGSDGSDSGGSTGGSGDTGGDTGSSDGSDTSGGSGSDSGTTTPDSSDNNSGATYSRPDLSYSQIKMSPPTAAEIAVYEDAVDPEVMTIASPNNAGISVNRFNNFVVDTAPLNIVNQIGNDVENPARLIVVIADDIVLRNRIEVVGRYADVLFLSEKSDGRIECNNCSFKNMYRIGLGVNDGLIGFSQGDDFIGNIYSSQQGTIELNNLYAPGAVSLDVIAGRVNTNGFVDLNTRVNVSEAGSYRTHKEGNFRIGTGSINLMVGEFIWHYDANTVVDYTKGDTVSVLDGDLNAQSVKLSAASPVTIKASINTLNHLVSTVSYGGYTHVADQQVNVNSYANASLNLDEASIVSQGLVNINSLSDLNISAGTAIEGNYVGFIAGGNLRMLGNTQAENIKFAADNVINNGLLLAAQQVKGWADGYLINQNGGEILSDTVVLHTDKAPGSYILNGSRTPYKSISSELLPVDADYYINADAAKLGTFYTIGLDNDADFANETRADKTHAHIRGKYIEINTTAFENINPFYQKVESRVIPLQRKYHSQVSLIAEDTLKVSTDQYIVNASAFMGAQRETSTVELKSGVIVNERYRVLSIQDMVTFDNDEVRQEGIVQVDGTTSEVLLTRIGVYSPPGMLFSLGNFKAQAQELFLNSLGYFEIFGNADIDSLQLNDVGMSHRKFQRDMAVGTVFTHFCDPCQFPIESVVQTEPEQTDSLFYVKGKFFATATEDLPNKDKQEAIFKDYEPFRAYGLRMIDDKLNTSYNFNYIDAPPIKLSDPKYAQGYQSFHTRSHEIDWENFTFTVDWFWRYSYFDATPYIPLEQQNVYEVGSGTKTYSIVAGLEEWYERFKDSVSAFLDTVTWWN